MPNFSFIFTYFLYFSYLDFAFFRVVFFFLLCVFLSFKNCVVWMMIYFQIINYPLLFIPYLYLSLHRKLTGVAIVHTLLLTLLKFKIMTTKVKSSATSRKGRKVSELVNDSAMNQVLNAASSIASPAGSGVGASGASPVIGVSSVVAGAAAAHGGENVTTSYNKVRQTSDSQINAAMAMESANDLKLLAFRSKVASNWAAPEWSGAAALRVVLAGAGLTDEQINAAVSGAARKSGEDLDAIKPSIEEVCEYISANYSKEFKTLCGCAVPAASAVRCYSYSSLSVATITADSDVNDYVITTAVPAGLSASGVVAAVLSVRVLVDVKRRISAARAAARSGLRENAALLVRRASRLGVGADLLSRYLRILAVAVSANDAKEEKRLRDNLSRCWSNLRTIENSIVLAAPAGAFGAISDDCGGWCFPASLPASAPAKCRKLWAKRVRVLSSINTLECLLARC